MRPDRVIISCKSEKGKKIFLKELRTPALFIGLTNHFYSKRNG